MNQIYFLGYIFRGFISWHSTSYIEQNFKFKQIREIRFSNFDLSKNNRPAYILNVAGDSFAKNVFLIICNCLKASCFTFTDACFCLFFQFFRWPRSFYRRFFSTKLAYPTFVKHTNDFLTSQWFWYGFFV